jgi:hypothetical protein
MAVPHGVCFVDVKNCRIDANFLAIQINSLVVRRRDDMHPHNAWHDLLNHACAPQVPAIPAPVQVSLLHWTLQVCRGI